jgi:hypothetical protein
MSIKPIEDKETPETAWERTVRQAVRGLRYGSVEVQVHEGRVVQIETREKVRFADDRPPGDRRRNKDQDGRAHRKAGGAVPPEIEETTE